MSVVRRHDVVWAAASCRSLPCSNSASSGECSYRLGIAVVWAQ